ncbi:MAG TPA: 2-oxoglutarate dehydrogenase E1 component, partial [Casimicrobiaceae bacterium]|nr:2-oxoglutarate dehydrogenase E1 component [Casimicrobiaceae bacterium]
QTQAQVPLLRLEQLYPFPTEALRAELERYPNLRDVVWTQEETRNHGSWYLVRDSLDRALPPGATLRYAGRPASAPTAVCNALQHRAEEEAFVARALGLAAD